jgi:hypothetical protein
MSRTNEQRPRRPPEFVPERRRLSTFWDCTADRPDWTWDLTGAQQDYALWFFAISRDYSLRKGKYKNLRFDLVHHCQLVRALWGALNATWLMSCGESIRQLRIRTSNLLEWTTQSRTYEVYHSWVAPATEYYKVDLLAWPVPPYPASAWDSVKDDGQLWALAEAWVHIWIQLHGAWFPGPIANLLAVRLLAELLLSRGRLKLVEETTSGQNLGRQWAWS